METTKSKERFKDLIMKNELGIKVCCANCIVKNSISIGHTSFDCEYCLKRDYALFNTSLEAMENRIRELQEQQFTKKEAEKIERFLVHGYQMMINENKKIFSKLEKMKGENNEQ